MEEIISNMANLNFSMPDYIMNDLEYICNCYVRGITELDFSQVENNMQVHHASLFELDDSSYPILVAILKDKLNKRNQTIDEILIHTYVEYYIEHLLLW